MIALGLCALVYLVLIPIFWLGICRNAARGGETEEAMKACEVCGKLPKGLLETRLMQGPKGYRRYQVCPDCRQRADADAANKGKGRQG